MRLGTGAPAAEVAWLLGESSACGDVCGLHVHGHDVIQSSQKPRAIVRTPLIIPLSQMRPEVRDLARPSSPSGQVVGQVSDSLTPKPVLFPQFLSPKLSHQAAA